MRRFLFRRDGNNFDRAASPDRAFLVKSLKVALGLLASSLSY